ncbi:hypothetical protein L7F22_031712 [Adiantum nelumboides]|nr:hypothetical protein [Adiantum nelumboides]
MPTFLLKKKEATLLCRRITGDASIKSSETWAGVNNIKALCDVIEQEEDDRGDHFSTALQNTIRSKDLKEGRRTHALISLAGCETADLLGSLLIRMFSSCGSLTEADQVFQRLPRAGCLSICAIICSYTKFGQANQAINLFFQACQSAMEQDGHTVAAVLRACSILTALPESKAINSYIYEKGFDDDVFIVNCLVSLYAQCGCLEDACKLFEKNSKLELVTWTVLIGQYTKFGRGNEALQLYLQMLQQGMKPDNVIFTLVLNACANVARAKQGMLVHDQFIESGFKPDSQFENSLIDMYAKCGRLEDACHTFLTTRHRDVVACSSMMNGFIQHGRAQQALELFWKMQKEGVQPNHITLACALKACSDSGDLCQAKLIHAHTVFSGNDVDNIIRSSLVNMYSKCGSFEDAHSIFAKLAMRRSVDWSMIMSASAIQKHSQESLHLNDLMQEEGLTLDRISFTDMLKACTTSMIGEARIIHSQIIESGFEDDKFVGASLIDTYSRCRILEDARRVFNQLSGKDVVIWGIMMTGYLESGLSQEVLNLLHYLQDGGAVEPNHMILVSVLKACSTLVALDEGRLIHCLALETGCEPDVYVGSSLINMYSKCGSLLDACKMFERLPQKNVVIWTAMIGGCAHHNEYKLALQYFEGMQRSGLKPDEQAFMCLLTACNHVGLANACHHHLMFMADEYGIFPTLDHVNCAADVFGRAGQVKEARDLETKTNAGNMVGWMSLLSHSQTHGNIKEAKKCLEHLTLFDRRHAAGYTIMSKVYATAGMQENSETLLALKDIANAWKKPGEAFIELENKVHSFTVGMRTHPQIQGKLQRLHVHMQERGYIF